MKVLLFTNLFPNPAEPERGIFKLQLAKALSKYCEITVISPLPWFPKCLAFKPFQRWSHFSNIPYHYKMEGMDVYYPKYFLIPKLSESIHPLCIKMGVTKLIRQLHQQLNFDVINSHWIYPDSVSISNLADSLGIAHIATGSGCDVNKAFKESNKLLQIKKSFSKIDKITAISSEMRSTIISYGVEPKKIDTILNGVNGELFGLKNKTACREKLNLPKHINTFLYIGRLSEEKGVEYLIQGMKEAQEPKSIGKLYIIGDGDLKEKLSNYIKLHNLSSTIEFVGAVSHDAIADWLGAADFLCLPSKREGCPNVVLEALSSGTPVLASKVGAVPDLINSSNGIMFEPTKSQDIAKALKTAVNSCWQEDAIRASVANMTWDDIAKKYIDTYQKAFESRRNI